MQPRIYTYKVTFEEIPHWYWGVHKEKKYGEIYLGSPVTHRWMWEFYTPRIQVLEMFPYTDEGWKQARSVEKRLILPDLNNTLCLNEACGCNPSLESCRKGGEISGRLNRGRTHTEKSLQNFRKAASRPEVRERRGEITLEVFSRPEVMQSVRQKALDRWAARKEELSSSMRGVKVNYKWWVNSGGKLRHCPQCPGPEWQRGRKWRPQ